jgi:hypothetical protein
MDIITLVGFGLLVMERIVIHLIRGLRHSKSKCCKDCCTCEISNTERSEEVEKNGDSAAEVEKTEEV